MLVCCNTILVVEDFCDLLNLGVATEENGRVLFDTIVNTALAWPDSVLYSAISFVVIPLDLC